jgi:hypothetical protein
MMRGDMAEWSMTDHPDDHPDDRLDEKARRKMNKEQIRERLEDNPHDRLAWSDELKRLKAPDYLYIIVRILIDELDIQAEELEELSMELGQTATSHEFIVNELLDAEEQLAAGVEIVREHEWDGLSYTQCPSCNASQYPYDGGEIEVHKDYCEIDKWLKEVSDGS